MKKTQKPLMLAYIIFLSSSLIYYGICAAFNIQFQEWQRIVVAATVASYSFSISSAIKYFIKLYNNALAFANEHLLLSKQLKNMEYHSVLKQKDKKELMKLSQNIIQLDNELVSDAEKSIHKYSIIAFVFDVAGYFFFFTILTFLPFYEFLKPTQEILTIVAFILILIVQYAESTLSIKYEERLKEQITQIKMSIEEFENLNLKLSNNLIEK